MNPDTLDTLTGALVGLVGTIVGAGISWLVSDHRARVQNALDLHREWQGEEMTTARMQSDRFIREQPGRDLLKLELEADPTAYATLMKVLNFFLRLSVLLKHGSVSRTLVPSLFGQYIVWWHVNCFESGLPARWVIRDDWMYLFTWLEKRAPRAAFARWRENAVYARDNRLAASAWSSTGPT